MSLSIPVADIVEANRNGLLGAHSSWERVLLSDVATVQNGFAFPSSLFSKGDGVPLLRIRDVLRGETEATFTGAFDPAYLVQAGDLLVGMDGDFNAALWKGSAALLNQRVCRIKPNDRFYDHRFLAYVLPGYLSAINAETSSITVKHLSSRSIEQIPLPLPPLPEQRRIVAEIETQFTRLDAAVAALERARANLKRYRAAVLDTLTHGSWDEVPLAEVSRIQGGIQKQPKRAPVHNAFPFLRVANVHRGRLDLDAVHQVELFRGELEKLRLEKGDLLVVEGNGSPSEIGRMAIWDGSIVDCVHQNHLIRIRLSEDLLPEFVEAYWNSPRGQRTVQSVASSTSGLYTLSVRKIGSLTVPVPPLDRQQCINQEVARRVSIVEAMEATADANMTRAERLRQSILRKAFSGQLVPQDPDDEPAEVLLERIREARASSPPAKNGKVVSRRRPGKPSEAQRALL